ncbi:hypothetical protein F4815DRAFT_444799 [Daldinia loculata]|nr:hypothetical protein F4815DRAFT_444799 [Daldinia loculata]
MCKTLPDANPGNPATGASLRARNPNSTINRRIRRAPGVLPGYQTTNRHGPPIFGRRRRNIFGKRVEGDINQEEDEEDSNDKSMVYPPRPGPYLNHADSSNYVHRHSIIPLGPLFGSGVDLRPHLSEAYNQLAMGSCSSHAVAGAFEFAIRKTGRPHFIPSRLYIWYYARLNLGYRKGNYENTDLNIGTSVEDALRVLQSGVCSENHWPYIFSESNNRGTYRFSPNSMAATEPNANARRLALQNTATYEAISTENLQHNLIRCLNRGFPFIFSMSVRDWLDKKNLNERNGYQMQVPSYPYPNSDKYATDWHAFLAVGYIPRNGSFIIRNSWGSNWADHGHFYMAYNYMNIYCTEFWIVR